MVVADLGGTHLRLGHVLDTGPAEDSWVRSTDAVRTSSPVETLSASVREYAARAAIAPTGLVMGVPVSLDDDFDRVLSSPNISALEGVSLATALERALGLPVLLERDIALLLQGEWVAGAGRDAASLLGVFIGTGVGGAFLLNGIPYRGASRGALEIGHIPIRDEGRRCVCGNVDCLEAYASGHHLRELQAAHGVPYEALFMADRPPALVEARDRMVRDLACAVATAVNLLDPERVVVGGGIPSMNGFPRRRFEAVVRDHLRRPRPAERLDLAWSALGSRAALYGAQRVLALRGPA